MDLLRLPLQTGVTALSRVVVVSLVLSLALGVAGEWVRWSHTALTFSFFYLYFLPFIALFFKANLGHERASDVRLLPDELQVEGGPHHGVRALWGMIAGVSFRQGRLCLDLGEVKLDLAHANNKSEQRSLADLRDALRSFQQRATSHPAPEVLHIPSLVVCSSCGAPAAVEDVATVPCESCCADVPIPSAVRAKFAVARSREASHAATERAVRALFHQPSSPRVNGLLAALSALGLGWLPLAAGSTGFGPTVLVSFALFLAGALMLRVVVANRRALSVVCLGFAARQQGHELACRSCGAPLPRNAASGVVATCIYCDAQNIVGVPAAKGGNAKAAASLDRALAARDRSVRAAVIASVIGLCVIGGALVVALC